MRQNYYSGSFQILGRGGTQNTHIYGGRKMSEGEKDKKGKDTSSNVWAWGL